MHAQTRFFFSSGRRSQTDRPTIWKEQPKSRHIFTKTTTWYIRSHTREPTKQDRKQRKTNSTTIINGLKWAQNFES